MPDPVDLGGGQWRVRVFLGEDKATGKQTRRQVTFKADGIRRARVRAHEIEAEEKVKLDAPPPVAGWTLAEAVDDEDRGWWALWSKRNRSPTTRKGYRSILDGHILASSLADLQVGDVTTDQVERWYLDLPVSPSTVSRIHAVLTQVFDQCVRARLLDQNPAKLARKPEARPKSKTHTTVATVMAVLEAADRRHPVRSRALAFAALTGLRRGEMCGIRWSALDAEQGILIVELNVVIAQQRFVDPSSDSHRPVLHVKDPKAHQVAGIALGSQATAIAAQQIEWQSELGADVGRDPYLWAWTVPYAAPLHPDTMTNWFTQAAKDAGVTGVSLHDLRHWQGSQVLEVGGTVQDVKERLRHKSLQTTMGYLHADHSKQRVLVDLLPRLELSSGKV